jgi:FkbM family methyltransferase
MPSVEHIERTPPRPHVAAPSPERVDRPEHDARPAAAPWRRRLRDAARRALIRTLNRLPDGALLAIREDVSLRRPLDYRRAEIVLEVDSTDEYYLRLSSCAKEPETVAWIEDNLRDDEVFFDIGANVGAYSLVAACGGRRGVRVFAFEPGFASFAKLCRNIALNGCDASITAIPLALSERTGLGSVQYSSIRPGFASHTFRSDGTARDGSSEAANPVCSQTVLTARLDDLVKDYGMPQPHLMKIDVDGAELGVLMGACDVLASPLLRAVLIEIDDRGTRPADVHDLLTTAGLALASSVARPAVTNHIYVRPPFGDLSTLPG